MNVNRLQIGVLLACLAAPVGRAQLLSVDINATSGDANKGPTAPGFVPWYLGSQTGANIKSATQSFTNYTITTDPDTGNLVTNISSIIPPCPFTPASCTFSPAPDQRPARLPKFVSCGFRQGLITSSAVNSRRRMMKATQRRGVMNVLAVDVGGTHIKILAAGQGQPRKFVSGPTLTPQRMVAETPACSWPRGLNAGPYDSAHSHAPSSQIGKWMSTEC